MGFDKFRSFMRSYIHRFRGSSVDTFAFASHLAKFSNNSELSDMVLSFATQPANPTVYIGLDKNLGELHLIQKSSEAGSKAQWTVPLWTVEIPHNSSCDTRELFVSCGQILSEGNSSETLHWLRPWQHLIISSSKNSSKTTKLVNFGCYTFR